MIRIRALVGQKQFLICPEAPLYCAPLRDLLECFGGGARRQGSAMNARGALDPAPSPPNRFVSLDKANVVIDRNDKRYCFGCGRGSEAGGTMFFMRRKITILP